uniref:Uncharacterized protein n=1 Tax=Parascaris univalens TaxID=6257 RepID=A0A915AH06_PARUN
MSIRITAEAHHITTHITKEETLTRVHLITRTNVSYKNVSNQRSSSSGHKRQHIPTTPCAPFATVSIGTELHACFICLKSDHQFIECSSHNKCRSCGGIHNAFLCLSQVYTPQKPVQKESPEPSRVVTVTVATNNRKASVALILRRIARVYNLSVDEDSKSFYRPRNPGMNCHETSSGSSWIKAIKTVHSSFIE